MILIIILIAVIMVTLYYSQKNESYVNVNQLPPKDDRKICPFVTRLDDPIMDSYIDDYSDLYASANQNGNLIIKDSGYPKPYTPQIAYKNRVSF